MTILKILSSQFVDRLDRWLQENLQRFQKDGFNFSFNFCIQSLGYTEKVKNKNTQSAAEGGYYFSSFNKRPMWKKINLNLMLFQDTGGREEKRDGKDQKPDEEIQAEHLQGQWEAQIWIKWGGGLHSAANEGEEKS